MTKVIIFCIFFSLTRMIFSCEEGNKPWFRQIEVTATNPLQLVLTCICKLSPSKDFQAKLTLTQDNQGNLYAQFQQEKELLLDQLKTKLDIPKAHIDFSKQNKVRIIIPTLVTNKASTD